MIEAIAAMNALLADLQSLASAATAPSSDQLTPAAVDPADTAAPTFSQALQTAIGRVDGTISHANSEAKAFSSGDTSVPLSDVMVSLEQANLSLQMASGVRDKVVSAYTNIMNMQV
jgi:flagellar hook-basal body complex protein FliE